MCNAHVEPLSAVQVDAVQFVLDKIDLSMLTEADMTQCHLKLIDAHLFLTASLDDDAIQSYLDQF